MNTPEQPRPSREETIRQSIARLRERSDLAGDSMVRAALDDFEAHSRHLAGQLEREVLKSRTLADATRIVNSSLDRDAVIRNILHLATGVMQAERGFVILRDGQCFAVSRPIEGDPLGTETPPSQAIVNSVFTRNEPVVTTDAQNDSRWKQDPSIAALGIRSVVCIPLEVRTDIIGAIYLDSRLRPGLFTQDDNELLFAFASQAALALDNARHFEDERSRGSQISELQAFQDRVLESIASGVITLGANREIITFNRAAQNTFATKAEKYINADAHALEELIAEFSELLDTFFASGGVHLRAEVEGIRQGPASASLDLEIRFSPLTLGKNTGVAIVLTDVTHLRALQAAHEANLVRTNQIEQSFSRYVAPHVVQSLMRDPASPKLGGERVRATMLFADVRGFTSIASKLSAEVVVELLNAYFNEAVRVIMTHDGLLDKFYGDGLMAIFGPPNARNDDPKRAIEAALALHSAIAQLAPTLAIPIDVSIGIATGDVVAGHIGSAQRMDYTVIGDAVNLAAALQNTAPPGGIYCDAATYESAGLTVPADRMLLRIKRRTDLVPVYALMLSSAGRAAAS